jgi:iron complex transport system ATP-binding protein
MENTIIEIVGFSFSISNRSILKDISFSVKEGEYISIVGPNGAGKTTLLKCLDRIYKGGSGDIRIAGKPLDKYSQKELAQKLSYVPQADGRILPFTVYEFVMMGRYPHLSPFSLPGKRDEEAVHDALEITGIAEFSERLLPTLSGGERQKVFIAAALAQGAKVLLLDEPTTFLDPKHQADVHRLLERANREHGFTVLSVTHDINNAILTSRRILALKDGAVVFCGLTDKFMNNEILNKIYEKSFLFVKHPQTGKTLTVPEVP